MLATVVANLQALTITSNTPDVASISLVAFALRIPQLRTLEAYSDSQALSGALLLEQFMAGEGYRNPGVLHAVRTAPNLRTMHLDFIHVLQAASQTGYDVSQSDTSVNEI